MGLRGSLADMGIIELVQYPHQGRKTGMIFVASPDDDARLFYDNGKLVHATMDEMTGMEVLSRIIDWKEGEFEFRPQPSASETKSIKLDLHRALMHALKLRDERKLNEKNEKQEESAQGSMSEGAIKAKLDEFIKTNGYALCACVTDGSGQSSIEVHRGGQPPKDSGKFKESLLKFVVNPPRPGLRRLFFEDELGTVVLNRLESGHYLLVTATNKANLGALSVASSRLVEALREANGAN